MVTRRTKQEIFKADLLSGKFLNMVQETIKGEIISNSDTLKNVLVPLMMEHEKTEKFYCIFLTAQNQVIEINPMFTGSLTSCSVYPREIIKRALDVGAAALILAHNHPSGNANPSPEDFNITKRLIFAAVSMGLTIHEHIIFGNGSIMPGFSMADHGYIADYARAANQAMNI